MKKITSVLALLLIVCMLLCSCGEDNRSKQKVDDTTTKEATTTIKEDNTSSEEETGGVTTKEDVTTTPESETSEKTSEKETTEQTTTEKKSDGETTTKEEVTSKEEEITTEDVTTAPEEETSESSTTAEETTTTEAEETTTAEEVTTSITSKKQSVKNGILFKYSNPANCVSSKVAKELIELCDQDNRTDTYTWFTNNGFTYVAEDHYDKAWTSLDDTSAWMMAKKTVTYGTTQKTLYLLTVRETTGYEWYRNVDFYSNSATSSLYADNFYNAAKDIFDSVKPIFEADKNALIMVCGHSRGAAVANLLGVLLDDWKGSMAGIWVYCTACPNTVRLSFPSENYTNIYNFINPSDVVTYLPLTTQDYKRAGTDYILTGTSSVQSLVTELIEKCYDVCPSADVYYNYKFSLTGAGEDEVNGITLYEILRIAADVLIDGDIDETTVPIDDLSDVSEDSDLYEFIAYGYDLYTNHLTELANIGNQHDYDTYTTKVGVWGTKNKK